MTLLHIDSSARKEGSVTRQLTAAVTQKLGGPVVRRDLADPLPHITEDWVTANFTPAEDRDPMQADILSLSDALVAELRAADTLILGAPLYNFGIPAALKTWIDLICRKGETFYYTEAGPVGLLEGKRAIVVLATGGVKSGSPEDFAHGHLKRVLNFIGITDIEFVIADQAAIQGDTAVAAANAQIDALAA